MGKEIVVYNSRFGDCFMLKDTSDGSSLLVDFGVHMNSFVKPLKDKESLLTKIADDIRKNYQDNTVSLLLTHFHEDHVNGIVNIYKNKRKEFERYFKNFYIADIWGDKYAVAAELLEEAVLTSRLKQSSMPRGDVMVSLFDLLELMTETENPVHFLSRGNVFEDGKYITLWPPKGNSKQRFYKVINDQDSMGSFVSGIVDIAEKTCECVNGRIKAGDRDKINLQNVRSEFENQIEDVPVNLEQRVNTTKLHELNHKYNIVFQNRESGSDNILFTGDAEKSQLRAIAKNTDIPLHEHYKYIKIPHHGTQSHYYDFSAYTPENVLIPNGKIKKENADGYRICREYGELQAVHVCNTSKNCERSSSGCMKDCWECGKGRVFVYPHLYIKSETV